MIKVKIIAIALALFSLSTLQVFLHVHASLIENSTIYFPIVINESHTISRYMQTTDVNILRAEGISQGAVSGVVILNFGPPRIHGSEYGTFLFDYYSYKSVSQIERWH